jgi:hypothetical protein
MIVSAKVAAFRGLATPGKVSVDASRTLSL